MSSVSKTEFGIAAAIILLATIVFGFIIFERIHKQNKEAEAVRKAWKGSSCCECSER
jgi:archaellum component FlaF (FlaF/FlaG flagellin family)